jgi:hypothetical protein
MRPISISRSEYLIDHYQVIFESGGGWHCDCAEFMQSADCRHAREAAGRREAQALIASYASSGGSKLARFAD